VAQTYWQHGIATGEPYPLLWKGLPMQKHTPIVFDVQPLWRWAVLTAEEARGSMVFRLIPHDDLRSVKVNALAAKAKKDGPALLAAWHRDRERTLHHGKPMTRALAPRPCAFHCRRSSFQP
jgi:hypothetical protein